MLGLIVSYQILCTKELLLLFTRGNPMLEELQEYLKSITTPENTEILIGACKQLEGIGILNHHFDLEQILMTASEHPTEDNLGDVYTLIQEYLEETLLQFGITLKPNANVEPLTQVLQALATLPDYGDPDALLVILEQELASEDTLCDLLGILTPHEWSVYADIIQSVNPALISRLKDVLTENRLPDLATPELYKERLYFLAVKETLHPQIALLALQEGARLKSPLLQLVNKYHSTFQQYETNPIGLANEVLGILALSDTPQENFLHRGGELIEAYAKDINLVTKTSLAFQNSLTQLQEVLRAEA